MMRSLPSEMSAALSGGEVDAVLLGIACCVELQLAKKIKMETNARIRIVFMEGPLCRLNREEMRPKYFLSSAAIRCWRRGDHFAPVTLLMYSTSLGSNGVPSGRNVSCNQILCSPAAGLCHVSHA